MPRDRNRVGTVQIRVSTTPQVGALLEQLVETGLYGKNRAEAVERLVARSLEALIGDGLLQRDPGRGEATRRQSHE